MFSKSCEYGIKAMIYIAKQSLSNHRVKITDVANNADSPEAFTAKILGTLAKHSLVRSIKGPNGGFEIDKEKMHQIKLSKIVFAIDGDAVYNGCALGLLDCSDIEPCPMHEHFCSIRNELKDMLETTSIYDLATTLNDGKTTLKRI